jgi:ATP-binding cassette subfamily F protein 3
MNETDVRSALAMFLFRGEDVFKAVSDLSGGERAKISLLKIMLAKPNFLILDEPTNHLDIISREVLENALSDFNGTLLVVSHDRYFINKLATRIADFGAIEKNRIYCYEGGFEDYIEHKKTLTPKEEQTVTKQVTASKEQYLNAKRDQAELRKQERRLKKAKEDVITTEARIEEINAELSQDKFFDYKELTKLSEELEECEARLLELYELIDELEGL